MAKKVCVLEEWGPEHYRFRLAIDVCGNIVAQWRGAVSGDWCDITTDEMAGLQLPHFVA